MKKPAEVSISHTQVARLTHEIGHELIEVRDRQAELHRYSEYDSAILRVLSVEESSTTTT